jgi:hypothetical protein
MSDQPSASPDLTAIDLSLSFAPAWAKETDSNERLARLADKHGRHEERPERGRDRQGPRRDGDRREPRRDRNDKGRPARGDRRTGGRRDDRREIERPPERAPHPSVTGWAVQFLPDRHGVEGLARQIKTGAKTYPLFDLARLVLEKSERYVVEFKRSAENATPIFQLKTDGTLWLSERDAIAHALAAQIDKFYRREQVTVEPPKGIFPCVAVCGMSGVLLGPPNYHDYQSKLMRLHAERFAHVPLEVYKSRIRMERSEEMVQKWKDEQSVRTEFLPIEDAGAQQKAKRTKDAPAPESAAPAEPAADAETVEIIETAASAEPTDLAESAAPAAPVESTESAEGVEAVESTESGETSEATESAEVAGAPEPIRLKSMAEVEAHFREHHATGVVIKIRERVIVPGSAALNDSAPAVLNLTRGVWSELDRFPLPLAHILGQQLAGRGLQIFKAHENITFVGVARPKYLDRTTSPVSEALGAMLDYIEGHSKTPRAEQWKALVALRPAPEADAEDHREMAVAADLSWLLHEGHVIDFARGNLEAARKPKPPTPPKAGKKTKGAQEPKSAQQPAAEQTAESKSAPAETETAEVESEALATVPSAEPTTAELPADHMATEELPVEEPAAPQVQTAEEAAPEIGDAVSDSAIEETSAESTAPQFSETAEVAETSEIPEAPAASEEPKASESVDAPEATSTAPSSTEESASETSETSETRI